MTGVGGLLRAGRRARAAASAVRAAASGHAGVPGGMVLGYHDVLPDGEPLLPYAVSVRRLRQHLAVIARLGMQVVPLRELSRALVAGEDVSGRVALAFDDALLGVHRLAMPALAERGWRATLHPVVDRMGVNPPWWPGSQRTMTWAELAEAVEAGLELGGHGTTHACLPCLDDAALAEELRAPRERLEDLAGRPVVQLAYPFGHYDPRVRDAVRAAGYSTAYTFMNGRVTSDADAWQLPRLTMHQGIEPLRLAHQLCRRADDWPVNDLPEFHAHDQPPDGSLSPAP